MMQTVPFVKKAYSMIMQEEQQHEVGEHTPSEVAHAMNVSNKSYKPPSSSSSSNSKAQETNSSKHIDQRSNSPKPLFCTYCEDTTHLVDKCYYLHGFPTCYKLHSKDVKPPNRSKKPSIAN